MHPKVTRKKPTSTTQHTTVLVILPVSQGKGSHPCFQLVDVHFLCKALQSFPVFAGHPGQPCPHTSPEQCSKRHGGAGGCQGRHRGMCSSAGTLKIHCLFAHVSRKDTFIPGGNDPLCRHDYNTQSALQSTNSRAPAHPAACKTRWGLNIASLTAPRGLGI